MKVWKLVSGILSIVFSAIVVFQSGAAGLVSAVEQSNDTSGSVGLLVAVLMLAAGIVSICVRKGGKGGAIALFIMFGLAALMGLSSSGIFADLKVWGGWCLICAIIGLLSIKQKKAE